MPDTIRTLPELNGIFADNDTGDVATQDLRDLLQSLLVHGVIGAINNGTPLNAVAQTPVEIPLGTVLHQRHIETGTANKLTTPAELTSAKYALGWEVNVQGQAGGDGTWVLALFNGASKIGATERKISVAAGQWGQFSLRIPAFTLAGGSAIGLGIQKESGTGDILVENASISLERQGIE